MAATKEMTKKRQSNTTTKKVEEPVVVEEVVEKKSVRKFDASDGVLCRSVTQGHLAMEGSKTNMLYEWDDYGDETEVEYRDLVACVRSGRLSEYIYHPYFIICDDDFINEFPQLEKFYTENYSLKDLQNILKMPIDEMLTEIRRLPKGAVDSLKNLASTWVAKGKIDSVKKIKALDDEFGTDLNLIADLFQ